MKQKNSHKSWILIVVLVAVLVGYVAVFFVPKSHEIGKLGKDLAAKQDFITQSEKTAPLLLDTEKKLADTTAYNKTWTKHAPRPGEISILLGKINSLARSANVAIDSFDPEPAEKFDRLRLMPLALGCSGRLAEIFYFLAELERMPQTIWIKNVTIEQSKNRAGSDYGENTQCRIDMSIFMDNLDISD
jgi:Tfp pilus assembly protein PilO